MSSQAIVEIVLYLVVFVHDIMRNANAQALAIIDLIFRCPWRTDEQADSPNEIETCASWSVGSDEKT